MAGKVEKPMTWKTYFNTEAVLNVWSACDIPVVDGGNYFVYLKIAKAINIGTLFRLQGKSSLAGDTLIISSYMGTPRLAFNDAQLNAKKKLSDIGDYPVTICCSLFFSNGHVFASIYDGNSNPISSIGVDMGAYDTPFKFTAYTGYAGYVSRIMIRGYDNA